MHYSQLSRVSIDAVRTMYISSIYNYTRKSIQCSPDENPRARLHNSTRFKNANVTNTRTHAHAMHHKTSLQRTLFAVFAFIALALPVDAAVYYGIVTLQMSKALLLIDVSSSSLCRRILVRHDWIQHVRRRRRRSTRTPSSVPMGT